MVFIWHYYVLALLYNFFNFSRKIGNPTPTKIEDARAVKNNARSICLNWSNKGNLKKYFFGDFTRSIDEKFKRQLINFLARRGQKKGIQLLGEFIKRKHVRKTLSEIHQTEYSSTASLETTEVNRIIGQLLKQKPSIKKSLTESPQNIVLQFLQLIELELKKLNIFTARKQKY